VYFCWFVADIIKLLPDAVANQIAAGEVVQRPASAVKELLENSLDAGATAIRLLIQDGGTSLIQVIDNGAGMSETDARMCWERHATSKIESASDIYTLRTFGFRGEALASIAAVAQVELKTRREQDDAATLIRIEGSKVLEQTYESGIVGTSISVKNLFFNIPARRNFLKSIAVESKHIMEEFQRQALGHPEVAFHFFNNGSETYNLVASTPEQRIKDVLGIKKDLLEVREQTEIIGIEGFAGLPESARKTRGDQFFFVNGRFIRSPYFTHAVQTAYAGTIEDGSFPLFVLNLSIDPSKVDVNVHPTKTEVKFEDERHIYNIIKAAVRKALGSYIMQPDMELFGMGGIEDFLSKKIPVNREPFWDNKDLNQKQNTVPTYNPFSEPKRPNQVKQDWSRILGPVDENSETVHFKADSLLPESKETEVKIQEIFMLQNRFILVKINDALFCLDAKTAQEKLLFHTFRQRLERQKGSSQQLLFPRTMELNPAQLALFLELSDDFRSLGFDVGHFGGNSIIVNGLPAEVGSADETRVIEKMLEDHQKTLGELKLDKHDSLALNLARQALYQSGTPNDRQSLENLVTALFALPEPFVSFRNRPVVIRIGIDLLEQFFRK
jgi:DNA mismatch repair protein MutL